MLLTFLASFQEGPAYRERCLVERKEAKPGPLSNTAAQREAGHMRKAVADRNRRITNAIKEASQRRKAEERARRQQEAADAKRREEEERQRLREEQAQALRGTRESLPRAASIASRNRTIIETTPEGTPLNPRLSSSSVATGSEREPDPAAAEQRDVEGPPEDRPVTIDDIENIVRGGVRPQPRRNTGPPPAFQSLIDDMIFPDADVEPGRLFAALIHNQQQLAYQNALVLKAVQNKNEVN